MSDEKWKEEEEEENKFRRRTSCHGLSLDIDRARRPSGDCNVDGGEGRGRPCDVDRGEGRSRPGRWSPRPAPLTDQQVKHEGGHLFRDFVLEEITSQGLKIPPAESITPLPCSPEDDVSQLWVKTGRDLRQIADEFARTKERRRVRQRANNIPLSSISRSDFMSLLGELFAGGDVTRERLVMLFLFCADVTIRALRQQTLTLFSQFMEWSLCFIIDTVCTWVFTHGGWGVVLSTSASVMGYTVCAVVMATCAAFIIYKMINKGGDK